ncbi:MAG: lecithin retinol acyltransferase family protein [Desulfovibrio sp.]|nr:lecithin retinol acyltransferase family protein [Desulfovibrio sp.]
MITGNGGPLTSRPPLPTTSPVHSLIKILTPDPSSPSTNAQADRVFRDGATLRLGSVVHCDLSPLPGLFALNLNAEHTGIYVGDGCIVHRNGDGYIEIGYSQGIFG